MWILRIILESTLGPQDEKIRSPQLVYNAETTALYLQLVRALEVEMVLVCSFVQNFDLNCFVPSSTRDTLLPSVQMSHEIPFLPSVQMSNAECIFVMLLLFNRNTFLENVTFYTGFYARKPQYTLRLTNDSFQLTIIHPKY